MDNTKTLENMELLFNNWEKEELDWDEKLESNKQFLADFFWYASDHIIWIFEVLKNLKLYKDLPKNKGFYELLWFNNEAGCEFCLLCLEDIPKLVKWVESRDFNLTPMWELFIKIYKNHI